MNLSDRKKKILQIVIDDYISSAQPVSSKSISDNYLKDISSATVRNELAALEELGYLSQMHTSSGRVPSASAYKLYVEELMDKKDLSLTDIEYIRRTLHDNMNNTEYLVKTAVKLISDLTNYTSLAISSFNKKDKIESVKIIRLKDDIGLMLVVTENNFYKDTVINLPQNLSDDGLNNSIRLLSNRFYGKTIEEIISLKTDIEREFKAYKEFFSSVIETLKTIIEKKAANVLLEGENKIFNQPEYENIDNVKNFLSVINDKEKIASMLETKTDTGIEVTISIDNDKTQNLPANCSLISAKYSYSGKNLGTYGVIGPMRMDYNKVISVLENLGQVLENIIKEK